MSKTYLFASILAMACIATACKPLAKMTEASGKREGASSKPLAASTLRLQASAKTTDAALKSIKRLSHEVDPMIGTDWVGNTYPGAATPFGMVQLSPDNGIPGWDRIAGYYYPDSTIAGFSHTHLSGTGAGDMYDISFMPTIAPVLTAEPPLGVHAKFSHDQAEAHAGYYSVLLQPYNIRVELTATPRVGVQRYTFLQSSDSACITLDLNKAMNWDRCTDSKIEVVANDELQGYRHSDGWARNQQLYFYTRLSRPADSITIERISLKDEPAHHQGYVAKLHYRVKAGDQIVLTTALSGVNVQGAKAISWAPQRHSGASSTPPSIMPTSVPPCIATSMADTSGQTAKCIGCPRGKSTTAPSLCGTPTALPIRSTTSLHLPTTKIWCSR